MALCTAGWVGGRPQPQAVLVNTAVNTTVITAVNTAVNTKINNASHTDHGAAHRDFVRHLPTPAPGQCQDMQVVFEKNTSKFTVNIQRRRLLLLAPDV